MEIHFAGSYILWAAVLISHTQITQDNFQDFITLSCTHVHDRMLVYRCCNVDQGRPTKTI